MSFIHILECTVPAGRLGQRALLHLPAFAASQLRWKTVVGASSAPTGWSRAWKGCFIPNHAWQ